jgi:hypothetical protein
MPRLIIVFATALVALALAAPASAFRLGQAPVPVADNPADHLVGFAPDPEEYDPATHCSTKPKPGMTAFVGWLKRHADGVFWGTYRCERWGPHEASLHAEGRAVDWHLDAARPADRREARRLIDLWLATDSAGNEHALARRMGIQEIIWNCRSWWSGAERMAGYSVCFTDSGKRRRHVNYTEAHKDHIHIGLSWAGRPKADVLLDALGVVPSQVRQLV